MRGRTRAVRCARGAWNWADPGLRYDCLMHGVRRIVRVVPALLLALAVSGAPAPVVDAASVSVHLGSPRGLVDESWAHGVQHHCSSAVPGTSDCTYAIGRTRVSVWFTRGAAREFIIHRFARPKAWAFLTTLLPAHARVVTCHDISDTGAGDGPTRACVYRAGKHLDLVAQYLKPTDPAVRGRVTADEGFAYLGSSFTPGEIGTGR